MLGVTLIQRISSKIGTKTFIFVVPKKMSEILSFDFHFFIQIQPKRFARFLAAVALSPKYLHKSMKQAASDETKTKIKIKVAKEEYQ